MTEREIKLLGFERSDYSDSSYLDDNGTWVPDTVDYYYHLDICKGMSFITSCKSEISDDKWYVDVFNTEHPIRFYEFAIVQALINQLTSALIKPFNK